MDSWPSSIFFDNQMSPLEDIELHNKTNSSLTVQKIMNQSRQSQHFFA